MNDRPIFILGAHKSGTSLLRSLLDGHPELFVIPFESHFLELNGLWLQNAYRSNQPEDLSNEEYIRRVEEFAKRYNGLNNPYADVILSEKIDVPKLRDSLVKRLSESNPRDRIDSYLSAIGDAYGVDPSKRVAEKSVENFEYASVLSRWFPGASFIHIVRNPYSNVLSLRKFRQKISKVYPRLDRLIETVASSYYYAHKNKMAIDRYQVIKYEDLVNDPNDQMKSISRFLDLPYSDVLLNPTSQGNKWFGNSTSDEKVTSVSNNRLNRWRNEIHKLEIEVVNRKMSGCFDLFGYERISAKGSKLRWLKGETLKKYISNRIYINS